MATMEEMRAMSEENRAKRLAQGLTATQTPAEKAAANPKSLRAAINAKCFECAGDSRPEVGKCELSGCSLHGLRPWTKVEAEEEIDEDDEE